MSSLQVMLDTITLSPRYRLPEPGQWVLVLEELSGWRGRAPDGTDTSEHWSGSGSSTGSRKTAARQITASCFLNASTLTGRGSIQAGLDALNRRGQTTLTVAEDDLVRQADVRLTQVLDSQLSPTLAKVTVSLTADDPLRYSAQSRYLSNGTLLLPNRGDQWAAPRILLTGPHDAISIGHHTGTWTFPALASGQSRLIDCRERIVWNSDTRVFGASSGPWPQVQPGGSTWVVAGLGAGKAILSRAEAWS